MILLRNVARFDDVKTRLDSSANFADFRESPFYLDSRYDIFSPQEYGRRQQLVREFMRKEGFDCLITGGGPSHWSAGYGMGWLTGHTREWHSMAVYLVFPREGEPTLVYSMGGTHIEAVRRSVSIADVRSSRMGKFGEVIAERIVELGLEKGRIGITDCDPKFHEFMPINHYQTLVKKLPNARIELVEGPFHELWTIKSDEEIQAMKRGGEICDLAIEAMAKRAKPGTKEYELRAAAGHAIMNKGADFNFLIIGSTPTSDPKLFFGNPRPSGRVLKKGDIILDEIAVEYKGHQVQVGTPICVGEPSSKVVDFFEEIVLPGFNHMASTLKPGNNLEEIRRAATFFREHGFQSRPIILHGLGVSSEGPEVRTDRVDAEPYETVLRPNMTVMLEPNPIFPDGNFGIFLGHSFVITKGGHERLTNYPLKLTIVR